MNLIAVLRLICSLLAAFFIGYAPVYLLFEYKRGCQKGYKKNGNTRDNTRHGITNPGQPNEAAGFSGFCCKDGFNNRHNISKQIFIFFISIYFGFFIISNYLVLLSLFKIKFGFLNAAVFGLIFCAAFIFIKILKFKKAKQVGAKEHKGTLTGDENNRKEHDENQKVSEIPQTDYKINQEEARGARKEKTRKTSLTFQAFFAFLIFINFCVVSFFTFLFPIRFWDAISCWSFKGRAFFLDGSVTAFYTQHQYTFTHLTYPLYISLSQTWIYIWLGEINETLVKAIFPLFYLSLIFIVYYLLRKEIKRLYAIISVFILSTLPVIMDHGYLEYTNLIFSVILLLGVYYFYEYILKSGESHRNDNRQNQNTGNKFTQFESVQDQKAQGQSNLGQTVQNQTVQSQTAQNQSNQSQFSWTALTQSPDIKVQDMKTRQNTQDNLKNLIISAVFFAILISVRSEGILFLIIFLAINTAYNLAVLPGSFLRNNIGPIAATGSLAGKPGDAAAAICSLNDLDNPVDEGNSADGSRRHKHTKTPKSEIDINDRNERRTICIKSIKSSKRRNTVLIAPVSILLPAALIFLLIAPWTFLQAKLNISGASTEWAPVIESLKDVFKNFLNGSMFVPGGLKEIFNGSIAGSVFVPGGLKNILNGTAAGGLNEISSLFSFKNAAGAFLGEFLFSKFDSARAFLGSSYGIAWIVLAVMAIFKFKKLFKAFNWIFFVFLSAGFIALFMSLGFIAEFAWSTERYMLHLFPLAYFWIMRSYLSSTILFKSFAPEK